MSLNKNCIYIVAEIPSIMSRFSWDAYKQSLTWSMRDGYQVGDNTFPNRFAALSHIRDSAQSTHRIRWAIVQLNLYPESTTAVLFDYYLTNATHKLVGPHIWDAEIGLDRGICLVELIEVHNFRLARLTYNPVMLELSVSSDQTARDKTLTLSLDANHVHQQ